MKAEDIYHAIMRLFERISALEAENEVLKRMLSEKSDATLIPLKVAVKKWECSRGWFYDLDKKYPGVMVKVSGKTCVNMGKINLLFGDPSSVPKSKNPSPEALKRDLSTQGRNPSIVQDTPFLALIRGIKALSASELNTVERYLMTPIVSPNIKCLPTDSLYAQIKSQTDTDSMPSNGSTCTDKAPGQSSALESGQSQKTSTPTIWTSRSAERWLATLPSILRSN